MPDRLRTQKNDGGAIMMKGDESKGVESEAQSSDNSQTVNDARKILGVNPIVQKLQQTLGEIGSRIHYFRKSQKMSQEKLAQTSGLDRAYISSVENGKQNITIGALLKLSEALGVTLADLVAGSQYPTN